MGEMLACLILENDEIAKSSNANILAEFISGFSWFYMEAVF